MKSLERVSSGCFKIEDSVTLEEFEKCPKLVSVEDVLCFLPRVNLEDNQFKKIRNGVKVFLDEKLDGEFLVLGKGELFGLAKQNEDGSIMILANLHEGEN